MVMEEAATISAWLALLAGAREYRRRLAQALAAVRVARSVNWKLAVLISLLSFISPAVADVPIASHARLGDHPDKTRVVLELSRGVPYRVFTLADPYRVVIDLPEIDWRVAEEMRGLSAGIVKGMRYGLFTPGRSRIVLDLERPARIKSVFVLKPSKGYPYRFVLDLAPASREAFLQATEVINSDPPLPAVQASTTPAPVPDERLTIIIDAGHGGVDPGAIGASGTYEKDVTLSYARALKERLARSPKYRAILTRDRDVYVKLADRRQTAKDARADLFIALHADAHHRAGIRGASVYTLSDKASDDLAEALADDANKSDIIAGIDLSDKTPLVSKILVDLAKRETMNLSATYASALIREFDRQVRLLTKPHRSAGFVVLKSVDVPSVLVELGFLSNPEEERLLLSSKFRRRIVESIAAAVDRYFEAQRASR
jgi:N-acetylmuramoyl-L-alanine amidase